VKEFVHDCSSQDIYPTSVFPNFACNITGKCWRSVNCNSYFFSTLIYYNTQAPTPLARSCEIQIANQAHPRMSTSKLLWNSYKEQRVYTWFQLMHIFWTHQVTSLPPNKEHKNEFYIKLQHVLIQKVTLPTTHMKQRSSEEHLVLIFLHDRTLSLMKQSYPVNGLDRYWTWWHSWLIINSIIW